MNGISYPFETGDPTQHTFLWNFHLHSATTSEIGSSTSFLKSSQFAYYTWKTANSPRANNAPTPTTIPYPTAWVSGGFGVSVMLCQGFLCGEDLLPDLLPLLFQGLR